jgi:hypothetical protein
MMLMLGSPLALALATRVRYRPPDHPEQPLQLIKHNSCTPIGSDRVQGLSEDGLHPYSTIRLDSWVLGCTIGHVPGYGGCPQPFRCGLIQLGETRYNKLR